LKKDAVIANCPGPATVKKAKRAAQRQTHRGGFYRNISLLPAT
jgi:hypothetical protein